MKNKLLLVLQLFIIDNIYSNNIIFPLSDPIYVLVRQEFLRFHDYTIFKEYSCLDNLLPLSNLAGFGIVRFVYIILILKLYNTYVN